MRSMRCVSTNRKHLSERLKKSKVSMSTVRYSGRLYTTYYTGMKPGVGTEVVESKDILCGLY